MNCVVSDSSLYKLKFYLTNEHVRNLNSNPTRLLSAFDISYVYEYGNDLATSICVPMEESKMKLVQSRVKHSTFYSVLFARPIMCLS